MTPRELSEGTEERVPVTRPSAGGTGSRPPRRKPRLRVLAAQVAVFVIVFGGWQLFTSLKIVDPFFFGQPSGIVRTLVD